MSIFLDREHFIPIRYPELIDFLCLGKGAKVAFSGMAIESARSFREFALALRHYFHFHNLQRFQQLKEDYAPFDPDADTIALTKLDSVQENEALAHFFDEMGALLKDANYLHLSREEMTKIMQGHSLWGLEMQVHWDIFQRLEMYYRGDVKGKRSYKVWYRFWTLFKPEIREVAEFNRLVVLLKQQPSRHTQNDADLKSVFMKMFKDIPKCDLEMVLPGTRVRLNKLDKGMIFYPLVTGFGIFFYNVLAHIFSFRPLFAFAGGIALSWGLATALAGYAYRAYYTYSVKKTTYSLRLTQSLYYQNLDSNAGVMHRLLDEAEEQECREVLLPYYYLWHEPNEQGWSSQELDDRIEKDFEKYLDVKIDFEIEDALAKLNRIGLIRNQNGKLFAISIEDAIKKLSTHKLARSQSVGTPDSAKSIVEQSSHKPPNQENNMFQIEFR